VDIETEPLSDAELRERLGDPSGPEDWSDVIAALADRLSASLPNRRPEMPIDEAAIVRNFAAAVIDMRIVVEGFASDMGDDWIVIRDHLDKAADGLTEVAEGWI